VTDAPVLGAGVLDDVGDDCEAVRGAVGGAVAVALDKDDCVLLDTSGALDEEGVLDDEGTTEDNALDEEDAEISVPPGALGLEPALELDPGGVIVRFLIVNSGEELPESPNRIKM